jgi:hypothetical protein
MKFIKSFTDYSKISEGLRYHIDNDLDLTDSVYRIGSEAYKNLFEEVKQYWDEGNIILKDKAAEREMMWGGLQWGLAQP